MGVSYNKATKTWQVEYEKADNPVVSSFDVTVSVTKFSYGYGGKGGSTSRPYQSTETVSIGINDDETEIYRKLRAVNANIIPRYYRKPEIIENILAEQTNVKGNNQRNADANDIASTNNGVYAKVYDLGTKLQQAKTPGNYLLYRQAIEALPEGTTGIKAIAKNQFDDFYRNEIVSFWDQKNAAKVPFEGFENTIRFDPDYYGSTNIGKPAKELWDKAVASGDLDVLGRHPNYQSYALEHYSTIGKNEAKKRGERDPAFKPITPTDGFKSLKVEETVPASTDAERQFERDKLIGDVLGLKKGEKSYELKDLITQYSDLIESDKSLQEQWNTAKYEIEYANRFPNEPKKPWAELYNAVKETTGSTPQIQTQAGFGELITKAYQLDPTQFPGAGTLIGQIKNNKKIANVDNKLSEYDIALSKIVTEAEKEKTLKAGVLQTEFLKKAQAELVRAKQQEQKFDLLAGTSFGKEILGLRGNIINGILEDSGVGGMLALGGKDVDDISKKFNLSLDTGGAFGSKNGMLYNWEKWFFDEIEKKYSGGLDAPNDYIPEYSRTPQNGFVTEEQLNSWKSTDAAFEELKKFPDSYSAQQKTQSKNLPKGYVPIEKRKVVKKEWIDYENARKAQGWVDNKTLAKWLKYDDAYEKLAKNPDDKNAKEILKTLPPDYVPKDKRIDGDIQFTQEFFTDYLLPRFDKSKSMSEFLEYIDVDKKNQNIFQTEDRLMSVKNAAEAASLQWLKALESLKPSKFNPDYYFDPAGYYMQRGVGGENGDVPVLLGEQFQEQWGNEIPQRYVTQKTNVNSAWEAAKKGEKTQNKLGQTIDWQANAYLYGLDINKKEDFAKLHYELAGRYRDYDGAPDVFNPQIASIYLKQTLVPYLGKKYGEIGTVFGQFADPEQFVNEFVESLNLTGDNEQRDKVFKLYGLDPEDEDFAQLKKYMLEALSSESAVKIREEIKKLNEAKETPTQELLGVEYIQRASDKREEAEAKSEDALYNRFKQAGYKGTEDEFYAEFMPDVSEEDRKIYQSAQTGKLKDLYSFKPTGDTFADLGQLESLSTKLEDEEEKTAKPKPKPLTSNRPTSKYFSFFPDEEEVDFEKEEEPSSPVKIKRGSDILAEFKSKLGLSSTAGKSSGSSLSDPFSSSFFGSF